MTPAQAQSRRLSLDQERANKAWADIAEVLRDKENQKDYVSKYGSLARSAPVDIYSFGLGQTLAFWKAKIDKDKKAKGVDEHDKLLRHVSTWVTSQMKLEEQDLLNWILQTKSTGDYRRATTEAIAFLTWLKRFAEAELG